MKRYNYFSRYIKLAPIQLALWRTPEVVVLSKSSLKEPVLDLACGDGVFTTVLLGGGKRRIYGIDIDKTAVKLAKKTGTFRKVSIANAEELPFENQSISTVISNSSIEHFENINKVFLEVTRVLKKEGKFVFVVPSIYLDQYWLTSALTRWIPIIGRVAHAFRSRVFSHNFILSVREWAEKLESANFKVVGYTYINNKSASLISDLFWPFRLPQLMLTRITGRQFLFWRQPALKIGRLLEKKLNLNRSITDKSEGSALVITAQKT